MQVEALITAKTKEDAEEAAQKVRGLMQAANEGNEAAPEITISGVEQKQGLFETSYFASLLTDFAIGMTSGLMTNLIYSYFKSSKKADKGKTTPEPETKKVEIDTENFSIIFIITDSDKE